MKKLTKRAFQILGLLIFGLACLAMGFWIQSRGHGYKLKQVLNSANNHGMSLVDNYLESAEADPPVVKIDISKKEFKKIEKQRELAMEVGNLWRTHPDKPGYAKAEIRFEDQKTEVKIRLKGGQEDHWGHHEKWSLKIKGDQPSFREISYYSLQPPRTRSYLNGLLFNKLLDHASLIHLRYEFVEVQINDDDYGIYAMEENMHQSLIEYNQKPTGPIINLDTDLRFGQATIGNIDYMYGAPINTYNPEQEEVSSNLGTFVDLRTKFNDFRMGKLPASAALDMDKMARYCAILDLMGYHHGGALYNRKFYGNPETNLFEPIGYDNQSIFPVELVNLTANKDDGDPTNARDLSGGFDEACMSDPAFYPAYCAALRMVADSSFLTELFEQHAKLFADQVKIIHQSYPEYHFTDGQILVDNAVKLDGLINPKTAIRAHFENLSDTGATFSFVNTHVMPIAIDSIHYNGMCYTLENPITLKGARTIPSVSKATLGPNSKQTESTDNIVYCRLFGDTKVIADPVVAQPLELSAEE